MSNRFWYDTAIIVWSVSKHYVYIITNITKSIHRKIITKFIPESRMHSYKFRIWNTAYEFPTHPQSLHNCIQTFSHIILILKYILY